MQSYYDRIKQLTEQESEKGFKRLGKVFKNSIKIQGLTGHEIHDITEALYGKGITPTHVGDLKRGIRISQEHTLHRVFPLCFKVMYWEPFDGEKFGKPVFNYQGSDYENTSKHRIMQSMARFSKSDTNVRPTLTQMPDYDQRMLDIRDLIDIIIGRNLIPKSDYGMKMPNLVFG